MLLQGRHYSSFFLKTGETMSVKLGDQQSPQEAQSYASQYFMRLLPTPYKFSQFPPASQAQERVY